MVLRVVISTDNVESKEQIKGLIEAIRSWELKTPHAEVTAILIETEPEIPKEELDRLFAGIYPNPDEVFFKATTAEEKPGAVLFGRRSIMVNGKIMGYCEDMGFTFSEATPEEIKQLQDAGSIVLSKMYQG